VSSWLAGRESQAYPCPFPDLSSSTKLAVRKEKINLTGAAVSGSVLATESLGMSPYPKLLRCPQSIRTCSLLSFSAEKKSVFLMFGAGLLCHQVVPVKVSTAPLIFHCSVSAGCELTSDAR